MKVLVSIRCLSVFRCRLTDYTFSVVQSRLLDGRWTGLQLATLVCFRLCGGRFLAYFAP